MVRKIFKHLCEENEMGRIEDNLRIEKNQGAFWSVYEDGNCRYKSTTPCQTPEAAARIGLIQALKVQAQQESSPVVLVEDNRICYVNLAAQERGLQIGGSAPKGTTQQIVEGVQYVRVV